MADDSRDLLDENVNHDPFRTEDYELEVVRTLAILGSTDLPSLGALVPLSRVLVQVEDYLLPDGIRAGAA